MNRFLVIRSPPLTRGGWEYPPFTKGETPISSPLIPPYQGDEIKCVLRIIITDNSIRCYIISHYKFIITVLITI